MRESRTWYQIFGNLALVKIELYILVEKAFYVNDDSQNLEQVQTAFTEAGLDYQLELENGKISIMDPSDIVSSEISSRLIAFLFAWINPRRWGRVFDSAGGFIMPDTNLKAPDVSFVRASRLLQSPRYFGELVPDLVV